MQNWHHRDLYINRSLKKGGKCSKPAFLRGVWGNLDVFTSLLGQQGAAPTAWEREINLQAIRQSAGDSELAVLPESNT